MNGDTNQDEQDSGEPKIIVDSDWKEQVARERETAAESVTKPAEPEKPAATDKSPPPPPPPASFEVLVSMLFSQAMALLGQLPDPSLGEVAVNKAYAKHYIDTLEMLGEKTTGNLSSDEASMLSEALHALRMTYVNVKSP